MQDAGKASRRPLLFKHGEQVVRGVGWAETLFRGGDGKLAGAAVQDDRLARCCSDLHLRAESGFLRGDVGVVEMVVVQTDLTDGDDLLLRCEGG